jgi:hypothetical protein
VPRFPNQSSQLGARPVTSDFLGWRAVHLDNGIIKAVVVPDIGGRVLQFWLAEHAFLFVNRSLVGRLFTPEENWGDGTISSWKNYGGNKTWPAPQGWDGPDQWAGPPDPVLDSGRFQLVAAEPRRAVVQSAPDPRTGLQITRELELEPAAARATLRRTMRNVSQRPVRWSLWDVTQFDCGTGTGAVRDGCWMIVPTNPDSHFPGRYVVQYGVADNGQWRTDRPGIFGIEYAGELGKVGLDSQAGWIAFSDTRDEWVFVHQYAVKPGATYPDDGATVEVWTHGPGKAAGVDFSQPQLHGEFMEMEVLGPLVELAPGEDASAEIVWAACRCPGPIRDVGRSGCTAEPLELQSVDGNWRLRAAFGVFAPGQVQLRAGSDVLLQRSASPLKPLRLDEVVSLPQSARAVELVFLDRTGEAVPLVTAVVTERERASQ